MKNFYRYFLLLLILTACQRIYPVDESFVATSLALLPGETPTQPVVAAIPSTGTPTQSPIIPTAMPTSDFSDRFLDGLPRDETSCLPDKTREDVGVYIYDLDRDQVLVAVNEQIPFQFASAFKAPVLVYFLESCPQYWDVTSPEWENYFANPSFARDEPFYTSDAYKAMVAPQLASVSNWADLPNFFVENRIHDEVGEAGPIDQRYFVLPQVYSMITQSNNIAAARVLAFVYNECGASACEGDCGESPLHAFNDWFDNFAGIEYAAGEERRGLYSWETVIYMNEEGEYVTEELPTYGIKDRRIGARTLLECNENFTAYNVWTPEDLFHFYERLYQLEPSPIQATAFALLGAPHEGAANGFLKKLAGALGAESISKNGAAILDHSPVIGDAGIIRLRGRSFIVVTLSFKAVDSITALYGAYDGSGHLVGEQGLIGNLLLEQVGE